MPIRHTCGWSLTLVSLIVLGDHSAPLRGAPTSMPIDKTREEALLKDAGAGFNLKRTPHFIIAYDTDESLAAELTTRLERTYSTIHHFCELIGINTRQTSHRLEAFFFNKRRSYDRYADRIAFHSQGTYGVYHDATNQSAFFNVANDPQMRRLQNNIASAQQSLDQLIQAVKQIQGQHSIINVEFADGQRIQMTRRQAEKEIKATQRNLSELAGKRNAYAKHVNCTVIQHETAHQVLYNAGVHIRGADNPKWIVEGLATLFETPPSGNGSGIGTVNDLRLRDFRTAIAGDAASQNISVDDLLQAIESGRIIPPRRLISMPELFDMRGPRASNLYATAWALTHYLHRVRGGQLGAYLRDVSTRQPGQPVTPVEELAIFEKYFGPIDETFLRRWGVYILKLKLHSVGRR